MGLSRPSLSTYSLYHGIHAVTRSRSRRRRRDARAVVPTDRVGIEGRASAARLVSAPLGLGRAPKVSGQLVLDGKGGKQDERDRDHPHEHWGDEESPTSHVGRHPHGEFPVQTPRLSRDVKKEPAALFMTMSLTRSATAGCARGTAGENLLRTNRPAVVDQTIKEPPARVEKRLDSPR